MRNSRTRHQHPQRLAAAGVLLMALLLAACRVQKADDMQAVPTNSNPAAADASRPPEAAVDGQPPGAVMKKECQGTEMRLLTDPPAAAGVALDSPRTSTLQLVGPDGATTDIASPAEMKDYMAVGLGCAVGTADRKPYFVVQYGQRPFGCAFCEWFYLYDSDGKQLTHSTPPILEDETLPEGKQQYPNNDEYEAVIQKLGIQHPEVDYIE